MTNPARFFSPKSSSLALQQPQKPQEDHASSLGQKIFGAFKHGVEDSTKPFKKAASSISNSLNSKITGTGKGFISGLQHKVEEALLGHQDLHTLLEILNKMLDTPEEITPEDIATAQECMQLLLKDNHKLLRQLAPNLKPTGYQCCAQFSNMIGHNWESTGFNLNSLEEQVLRDFTGLLTYILKQNPSTADKIQNRMDKAFSSYIETIDKKLTQTAPPLLSQTHYALCVLQSFLWNSEDDANSIQPSTHACCQKLASLLKQLMSAKLISSNQEIDTVSPLLSLLSSDKQVPISQMKDPVERAYSVVDARYKAAAGITTRVGDIVQQRVEGTTAPLFKKAESLSESTKAKVDDASKQAEKLTRSISQVLKDAESLSGSAKTKVDDALQQAEDLVNSVNQTLKSAESLSGSVKTKVDDSSKQAEALMSSMNQTLKNVETLAESVKTKVGDTSNPLFKRAEELVGSVNQTFKEAESLAESMKTKVGDASDPILGRAEGLVSSLNPLLNRVETLPNRMINNLMGNGRAEVGDAANGEGTLSGLMGQGESILQTMIKKGGQALSKQALGSLTGAIAFGLRQVLKKMDQPGDLAERKQSVETAITNLAALTKKGDWKGLSTFFKNTAESLSGIKFSINGFQLPGLDQIEEIDQVKEESLSESVNELGNAINTLPKDPQNGNWKESARQEKDKLIENAANYLTLKRIYEGICGLRPSKTFYTDLIRKAKAQSGADWENKLRELLFEEIEGVNFLVRAWAKIEYFIYKNIVVKFTKEATNIYFDETFDYIEKNKGDQFGKLRKQTTNNFTRYLTILNGAYNNIAKKDSNLCIGEMLKEELEKKELNLGFETQDLYKEFTQTVITKVAYNSKILGWIISGIVKLLYGNLEERVRSFVSEATNSIHDTRGYTHAVNLVIYEQLEDIWQTLQAKKEEDAENTQLSKDHKAQLVGLSKNLFEVLEKNRCQTVKELQDVMKGKSTKIKINQAIDGLFIEDVLEQVTHALGETIHSIAKEDQLQKLAYRLTSLMNSAFNDEVETNVDVMQELENKISNRCDQILRMTVRSAVAQKFDFTGNKQQTEVNQMIEQVNQRSKTHTEKARGVLSELERINVASSPEDAHSKIDLLAKDAHAFRQDCDADKGKAKGLRLNSDNLSEVEKSYSGLQEHSKPYIDAMTQLKLHSKRLKSLNKAAPHLEKIQILTSNPPQSLEKAEEWLTNLEQAFNALLKARSAARSEHPIVANSRVSPALLNDKKKVIAMRDYCFGLLRPDSAISHIAASKKSNDPGFENALNQLKIQLSEALDPVFLSHFLKQLELIKTAAGHENVDAAQRELQTLLSIAIDEADRRIEEECFRQIAEERKTIANRLSQIKQTPGNSQISHEDCKDPLKNIGKAVDTMQLSNPQRTQEAGRGIREEVQRAKKHLETLSAWEAKPVTYINFSPVNTRWVQDAATNVVYKRLKKQVEGFTDLLRREETYRYGLLNHLFLIPYNQSVHKKNN